MCFRFAPASPNWTTSRALDCNHHHHHHLTSVHYDLGICGSANPTLSHIYNSNITHLPHNQTPSPPTYDNIHLEERHVQYGRTNLICLDEAAQKIEIGMHDILLMSHSTSTFYPIPISRKMMNPLLELSYLVKRI